MKTLTATVDNSVEIKNLSSSSLYDEWVEFCDVRESTEKTYRKAIKNFKSFLSENSIREFSQLSRKTIIQYRKTLVSKFAETETAKLYFTATKIFLQFLSAKGFIDSAKILEHVKTPKLADERHRRDALTVDEVRAVLDTCDDETEKNLRDKISLCLMSCLGLRTCELSRLNCGDFIKQRGQFFLFVLGKGRDSKVKMPVPVEIAAMLTEYIKLREKRSGNVSKDVPLIVATSNRNKDQRLQEQTFSRLAKSKIRAIGIDSPSYCAHSFRHFFASTSLAKTNDTRKVMKAMRHRSLSVTERYLHDKVDCTCFESVADEVFRKGVFAYGK